MHITFSDEQFQLTFYGNQGINRICVSKILFFLKDWQQYRKQLHVHISHFVEFICCRLSGGLCKELLRGCAVGREGSDEAGLLATFVDHASGLPPEGSLDHGCSRFSCQQRKDRFLTQETRRLIPVRGVSVSICTNIRKRRAQYICKAGIICGRRGELLH